MPIVVWDPYAWVESGAQTMSGAQQPDGSGAPVVTATGTTTVTFTALDAVGNASTSTSADVVISGPLADGPAGNPHVTDNFHRADGPTFGTATNGATWLDGGAIVNDEGVIIGGGDGNGGGGRLPLNASTLPLAYTTTIAIDVPSTSDVPAAGRWMLTLPGIELTNGDHGGGGGGTTTTWLSADASTNNTTTWTNVGQIDGYGTDCTTTCTGTGPLWNIKVLVDATTTTVWLWQGDFRAPPTDPTFTESGLDRSQGLIDGSRRATNPFAFSGGQNDFAFGFTAFDSGATLRLAELNVLDPTVLFDNTTPTPGATVHLTGSGFDPGATVSFTCDPSSVCPIADQTADSNGDFGPLAASIPSNLTDGTPVTVTASGSSSGATKSVSASALVTIPVSCDIRDTFSDVADGATLLPPHHTDTCGGLSWTHRVGPPPIIWGGQLLWTAGDSGGGIDDLAAPGIIPFPLNGSFDVSTTPAGGIDSDFRFGLNYTDPGEATPAGAPAVFVEVGVGGDGVGHIVASLTDSNGNTVSGTAPFSPTIYNSNCHGSGSYRVCGIDYSVSFQEDASSFTVSLTGAAIATVTLHSADSAPAAIGTIRGVNDFYFAYCPACADQNVAVSDLRLNATTSTPTPTTAPAVGINSEPILPPTDVCSGPSCTPFSATGGGGTVSSDPVAGWTLDDANSPAITDAFPATAGAAVTFNGTWFLNGHYAQLQLCYIADTAPSDFC